MYDIKDIGKRITSYRKNLNMTQEELAAKLNITAQAVSKWENGLSLPDITIFPELACAFNTSIDKLFGNEASNNTCTDIEQIYKPRFPEYMSNTLKLVHTLNGVGCYSEKEVDVTNEDTVIFKDSSSANLRSLKVVNRGPGDICFDYIDAIPYFNLDVSKAEIHETFEGIASVKMGVDDAKFELVRSKDQKTHVDINGSPVFIAKMKIARDGDLLTVKYENDNNNNNHSGSNKQSNKVTISFGRDEGENIDAYINGAGKCDINVPFEKGSIKINGSGEITFNSIDDVECKINGSGDIKCNKAGNVRISINGSGDFEANEIKGSMKSSINGSGDIHAGTGEIDTFETKICGSGDVFAENICTRVANVAIQGSGDITIGRVIEESIEKHSKNSTIKVLKRG